MTDDSAHWYLIPFSKRDEWLEWEDFASENPDDPRAWNTPVFAKRIDGCHGIAFLDPVDIDKLKKG